jgi:hypothetical protein
VQTRTRNAIALAAIVALGAAGLAAVAERRKTPDLGGRALDAVPSGAMLVGTADLAALRASPVGATLLREGREIPGLGKVKDVCGFDPLDTLAEAAIAIPAAGDTGEFGLVAAGPINDEALLVCASKVIEARGGRPVVTTVGSFRSVRDAALATAGGEIAVKKGGPLLLGAGTYLRSMIDAADGRTPTVRSSRAHAALAREVAGAAVRVTVVLTQEQRRSLLEELVAGGAAGSPAGAISGGALGVSFGPSVGVHGVISCDDAAACAKLAGTLEDVRKARARDALMRLVGVGAVLEQLNLRAEGELLHARVEVPADQATLLAERLLALRNLRRNAPDEEPPARPERGAAPSPDEVIRPGASPSALPSASPSASAAVPAAAKASAAPSAGPATSASAPPKKR